MTKTKTRPEHTCCNACRTGDYSGLPTHDMDGSRYDCGCECEACYLECCEAEAAERDAQRDAPELHALERIEALTSRSLRGR